METIRCSVIFCHFHNAKCQIQSYQKKPVSTVPMIVKIYCFCFIRKRVRFDQLTQQNSQMSPSLKFPTKTGYFYGDTAALLCSYNFIVHQILWQWCGLISKCFLFWLYKVLFISKTIFYLFYSFTYFS